MVYDILMKLLNKHLFVVMKEKYKSESSDAFVERYVAKHLLLRPELIVVNDQVFGFKKMSEKLKGLEKLPIYFEIEYAQDENQDKVIESFDLYAETQVKSSGKLADIGFLANLYSKTISVEHTHYLNVPGEESLLVYSKMMDIFSEEDFEMDIEEGLITEAEAALMIEVHLISFVNFVKLLDEILGPIPLMKQ